MPTVPATALHHRYVSATDRQTMLDEQVALLPAFSNGQSFLNLLMRPHSIPPQRSGFSRRQSNLGTVARSDDSPELRPARSPVRRFLVQL
jgi:hypothetical protein